MAPQHQNDLPHIPDHFPRNMIFQISRTVDEDDVCLYPSKKCTNARAKKKNGDLHTMCEYHRIRANENQRRLERRRKAALRFPSRFTPKPSLWNREFPEPIPIHNGKKLGMVRSQQAQGGHWQPIEIEILIACLFDDGTETPKHTQRPACPPFQAPEACMTFAPM